MKYALVVFVAMIAAAIKAQSGDPIRVCMSATARWQGLTSKGSTGVSLAEREYGRVTFAVYDSAGDIVFHAVGSRQYPQTFLSDPSSSRTYQSRDVRLMADLCVEPIITPDNRIRLRGVISYWTRQRADEPGLFSYAERPVNVVLDGQKDTTFNLPSANGDSVLARLWVVEPAGSAGTADTSVILDVNSEYTLENLDAKRTDVRVVPCAITRVRQGQTNSQATCVNRHVYRSSDDIPVLLRTAWRIENMRFEDDGSVALLVGITRDYATRPADTSSEATELRADKIISKLFTREVRVLPGRSVDLVIEADADSPLPFKIRETIRLTPAARPGTK